MRVFITGIGIVSALGHNENQIKWPLFAGESGIRELSVFPSPEPMLVGEVPGIAAPTDLPRTHVLARMAATRAMRQVPSSPDAIVLGVTTGGMPLSEVLFKTGEKQPERYAYHGLGTVALDLAEMYGCTGPVITVSTACSSGTVAIEIALEMIRSADMRCVLAGGVDALCRLTCHGFRALQAVDARGSRPMDKDRNGMSVAEGAAFMVIEPEQDGKIPETAVAQISGGGLSCDAWHPTAPHPEGDGAYRAILAALKDAGLEASDIDYINLHGTGTRDNDLSESRAIRRVFGRNVPPLSSVKGALGHSLAASGAMEAVFSTWCITENRVLPNPGFQTADPELGLIPVTEALTVPVTHVLSNSFGFGGNNAALVISDTRYQPGLRQHTYPQWFTVEDAACITGAGFTDQTLSVLMETGTCQGVLDTGDMSRQLDPAQVRRLHRLQRMALALANEVMSSSASTIERLSVFMGTGWGPLTETHRFLTRLFQFDEQFSSPTDFVGSVHNAPAGQVAMGLNATDVNITTSGGDYSFEQALLTARYLVGEPDATVLVMGADEHHPELSPLLDMSVGGCNTVADGGGALRLIPGIQPSKTVIRLAHYCRAHATAVETLIKRIGGTQAIKHKFGAVFVGIPSCVEQQATSQMNNFFSLIGKTIPALDYRQRVGQFASASAVATVIATRYAASGAIAAGFAKKHLDICLDGRGILILGLGNQLTAIEVLPGQLAMDCP